MCSQFERPAPVCPVCLPVVVTETTVGSPDVFVGGEEHDGASVAGVQQQADDFVEVRRFVLVRDLQRLSDADSTCRHTGRGLVSARPITGRHLSVSCRSRGERSAPCRSLHRATPPSQNPSVPTFLSSLPPSSPFLSYFPSLFFPSSLLTSSPFIPPSLPPTLSSHFLSCVLAYILFFPSSLLSFIPPSFLFPPFPPFLFPSPFPLVLSSIPLSAVDGVMA